MTETSKMNQQLMKTVYIERLGDLIPTLLKWFQAKETLVQQFNHINKEMLCNIDKFSHITQRYLQYIIRFLSDQKDTARKMMEIKQNRSFLKTLQKQKLKKTSEQEEKAILQLHEWNPTLLKFMEGLGESTLQQHTTLKKFYYSLDQLIEEFEKIEDNYKSFVKKHLKLILKKTEDIEDSTKAQKKILSRYHNDTKKYSKDAVATISDVKLVEYHSYKQIDILVERGTQINTFIQQMIQYETAINNTFKERFLVFVSGEESVFKLTNRMMALPKLIEKIDKEQVAVKSKYFQVHILSQPSIAKIKTYCGFLETDNFLSVKKYLGMSSAVIIGMFDIEKAMKEFIDHVVFRKWNLELSEGWLIESWTKCQGYITLDNIFILFGHDAKPHRVIDTKNTKINKKQDDVVYLVQSQKGLFKTSTEEYKIKFQSKDTLEQFQLYLDNKIS